MAEKLMRVYKKMDLDEVRSRLLIYGDLGGLCASCQEMNIPLDEPHCPGCRVEFYYIAFRNVKGHMPKILKLHEIRPHILIVDYEDYRYHEGASKAKEFLK